MDNTPNILISLPEEANLQLPSPELVNFYNDLKTRTFWIDSEIDENSLSLVQYILQWNREDLGIPVEERKPIRLLFYSMGGSLDVEETLVSMIKLSKTPIYGIALGVVASAASLIYLACHKRYAFPNAYFVLHKGSCNNIGGNFNEVQAAMEDYRAQIEKMEKFYIENTTYPEEVIKEKIKTDWYIHIEEAVQFNIVNEVLENIDVLL